MNAVRILVRALPFASARRLALAPTTRFAEISAPAIDVLGLDGDQVADGCAARYDGSLVGFLNACHTEELAGLAQHIGIAAPAAAPSVLRWALWQWGAALEACGAGPLDGALQPVPTLLAGRLVVQAPAVGLHPPAAQWPRPLPEPRTAEPPVDEPESLDELLAAADRAIGVPLGDRGRDKGAWGVRAAALLGVPERGVDEPDWRGDVEIKTVPVARDASGRWRVREDPAIAMEDASPIAKLQRVLWLVRAATDDGATILSWYLATWDGDVPRLVRRYLHTRPKGPANTDARGWYLHKRFFAECGLLASLNGP